MSRARSGWEARFGSRSHIPPVRSKLHMSPPTSYPELEDVSIIVVDDNPTQLGVLTKDLTDFGMSVTALDSASAALSTLRKAAKEGKPI